MKRSMPLLVCAMTLTGCIDMHSTRNLPGDVTNLRERPHTLAEAYPEQPAEDQLLLSAGPWVAAGGDWRGDGSRGAVAVGGEATALYAYAPHGHVDSTLSAPSLGVGASVGGNYVSSFGGSSAVYAQAEGRLSNLLGLGLGWQVDPVDRAHGPQATLRFGPLFVRVAHQLDRGTLLTVGLFFQGQLAYSRSR